MVKKVRGKAKVTKAAAGVGKALPGFTLLEKNILLVKGLSPDQLTYLNECGVRSKDDLRLVGDSATLSKLARIPAEVAEKVMSWALGAAAPPAPGTAKTLEDLIKSGEYIPWEDLHIRE